MLTIPDGRTAHLSVTVTEDMTVHFHGLGPLHPVYATYELARHFEEVGRALLLPYLEAGEDGVGTEVNVQHHAPALPGMRVDLTATLDGVQGRRLRVTVRAVSELGDVIATGHTEQHVTARARLEAGITDLRARWTAHRAAGTSA